jgi:hypothetical protein
MIGWTGSAIRAASAAARSSQSGRVHGQQRAQRVRYGQVLRVRRRHGPPDAERLADQLGPLDLHGAQRPVPAEGGGQPHRDRPVADRNRAADRGVQVVLVGRQSPQPVKLLATEQVILARLGQPGEILRVRFADLLRLPRLGQPFLAVGPDDLQHPVPGRVVPDDQQRLVGQCGQQVQDLVGADAGSGADLLGRLQRGAAGEDRETAPERALGVVEQVPAPVHHRAQRLMPGHRGAAAAGQQLEPVAQPGRDLLGGHGAQPGRGQLDGQRHAVERPADHGHGGRVVFGDLEAGHHGTGPLGEQADRGGVLHHGPFGRKRRCGGVRRQGQRAYGPQRLAGDVQRLAAGGQDQYLRAGGQHAVG